MRPNKVLLYFATSLILMLCTSLASAWELKGTVTDTDGNPIPAVSVLSDVNGQGTVTDDQGKFSLKSDSDKPTRLTFSHIGYKPMLYSLAESDFNNPIVIVLEQNVLREQRIVAYGSRAETGKTPVAHTDITSDEIQRDYSVGELPNVLSTAPNIYTYSDAGSPLGYSHLSIRGFSEQRISVYVNGVPLNDPEDHVTYFHDLPDFVSNVNDIQIQRGVGASLYGDGAFGGSVNIVSNALEQPRGFSFTTGVGEYYDRASESWIGQTNRQNVEFSSGLIDGQYHVMGRYSRQKSDGYMEYSQAEGWSYFLTASRLDPRSTTTVNLYGGPIRAHAAWDGIDLDTYRQNRRANFLTYHNEGDVFNQPHYELHNTYQFNEKTTLTSTLYYIRGEGYYEQYKAGEDPAEFNIDPSVIADPMLTDVDVVTQQWVLKDQIGINLNLAREHTGGETQFGLAGYYFDSDHWGQVNSSTNVTNSFEPGIRYYHYYGIKKNLAGWIDERLALTDKLNAQLSLQVRYIHFKFREDAVGAFGGNNDFQTDWFFVSPRLGLNYALTKQHSVFGSFSIASRTPRDVDLYDANDPAESPDLSVEPERLYDYELGYSFNSRRFDAKVNLFYMLFDNEVIFYGVDDDGSRLTDNADRSYHAGIELAVSAEATNELSFSANFSYNHNRYTEYMSNTVVYDPSFNVTQTVPVDHSEQVIPNFPEMLGNFIADYKADRYRLTYRFQGVGKQYVESENIDSLSIKGFGVSSITGSVKFLQSQNFGDLSLALTVNNIFDHLHIQSGYGGIYLMDSDLNSPIGWGAYYPDAGRSYFLQLRWAL